MNDFKKARELGSAKKWKNTRTVGREKFIRKNTFITTLLSGVMFTLMYSIPFIDDFENHLKSILLTGCLFTFFISFVNYWAFKKNWEVNENNYLNYIREYGESEIN